MSKRLLGLGTWLLGLFAAGPAFAQSHSTSSPRQSDDHFARNRNMSVQDRLKAHGERLGYHAGGLWIKPELLAVAGYDDNIGADEFNPTGGAVYELNPRIDIDSDWG